MKQLKQKCRFFLPDRPCVFHKEQGLTCQNCSHYQPGSGRLLIVKREALGDVLRTTALLQPLRKRFPEHRIIWLTARESQGLLKDNPWLDEVWTDDTPDTVANLTFFQFEVVINLDLSRESLLLAGLPQARTRIGFWYNPSGEIVCSGAAAENWLLLSHDDRAKKHNKLSYQRWMADIIGLKQIGQIFVPLPDVSLEYARLFAEKYRLSGQKVVGLNVGSGPAWVTKRWPEANWLELTQHLEGEAVLLLLGGREEEPAMKQLLSHSETLLNGGWDNKLTDFFALLNLSDVVVTGDTLALHAATGLKKKVVALFGPTSAAEIEDYGLVSKVITPLECYCCYRRECPDYPSCMAAIKPATVARLVRRLLHE